MFNLKILACEAKKYENLGSHARIFKLIKILRYFLIPKIPKLGQFLGYPANTFTLQIHQSLQLLHFFVFICQFIHIMTHTKYQKYVFGLKSSHLKIGANGAGAYTIPRSVS